MILLDGKKAAEKIKAQLAQEIARKKIKPGLGIIVVGNDPASRQYVSIKQREACALGFHVELKKLPPTVSQKILLAAISAFNRNKKIHGFIVQLPLPKHLNAQDAITAIDPKKDADGFHPENIGRLMLGLPGLAPATPTGIIKLLDTYQVRIAGKHAVVVGRSNIVGKPLASMLLNRDATVTICHSKTKQLARYTKDADILIVSVGTAGLVKGSMIKKGACVIDVGMNRERGRWIGDIDFASAAKKAKWISPVPGGIGPMTVALLLRNTLDIFLTK